MSKRCGIFEDIFVRFFIIGKCFLNHFKQAVAIWNGTVGAWAVIDQRTDSTGDEQSAGIQRAQGIGWPEIKTTLTVARCPRHVDLAAGTIRVEFGAWFCLPAPDMSARESAVRLLIL